ncbi:MAG: hypothetical protein Tsb009_15360 [Planctomycetaceae bacterium]
MVVSNPFIPVTKVDAAPLEVYLLGVVDFNSAVELQNRIVYDISGREDCQGTLLICEHPPLVTIGREGSRSDILVGEQELQSRQLDVRWMNRGGGCVVHGLGQLAIYPMLPLGRLKWGLSEYRYRLENALIDVCAELKVPAKRDEHEPGVYCRDGQLASTGIAVKSWVSSHGMYLNVSPSMELMRLARPSSGREITSLSAYRVRRTFMHKVREAVVRRLVERFHYERFHVYSSHPLLKRTRRRIHVPA